MHVSSSFATAREYTGDTVILYFRIRETPNVVVVTVPLVIYVFSERVQPTQGGDSVLHTRGPFYRLSALAETLARSARRDTPDAP